MRGEPPHISSSSSLCKTSPVNLPDMINYNKALLHYIERMSKNGDPNNLHNLSTSWKLKNDQNAQN